MLPDQGASQREIERRTGVDRKTIRRYMRVSAAGDEASSVAAVLPETANSPGVATGSQAQIPPPWPPALPPKQARSAEQSMAPMRRAIDFITAQQEPFPAFVVNRYWDILATNRGSDRLFSWLRDDAPHANIMRKCSTPMTCDPSWPIGLRLRTNCCPIYAMTPRPRRKTAHCRCLWPR
jgi:MmyB-like transcription regulator ligand binding domain